MRPFDLSTYFTLALTLSCMLGFSTVSLAQLQNCGLSSGSMVIVDGELQPDSISPAPMYDGGPDSLSLNQYFFSFPDSLVTDSFTNTSGALIFHANDDGQMVPSDFGMQHGDRFCVQYLHFSLDVLQEQIDSLFLGSNFGVPCCDFAELIQGVDVCHIMDSLEIFTGADIAEGNGLIDFAVGYGVASSFEAIAFLIDSMINILPGGSCVASTLPMCYSLSAPVCFAVDSTAGISFVSGNGPLQNLIAGPNPASSHTVLSFHSLHAADAILSLSSMEGRLVLREERYIVAGDNNLFVKLDQIPPGVYALSLNGINFTYRGMLLIE